MNFSQIKCFLAAADCLSFTRAADRLYLSQPVLSRQIAAMEDELGMELFIREKKTVQLTAVGTAMAEGFTRLAAEYRSLVEEATAIHNGFQGRLNIGMIEGQLILPPYSGALTLFHAKYPNVQVNLSKHTLSGLRRALDSGNIDMGFTSSFEMRDDEELEFAEVGRTPTMLVVPKNHPNAGRQGLHLSDFKNDTFLTLPESESPHIASSIKRLAEKYALNPRALEAPNIGALALWLEAGYGIFALNANHSLRNNPNLVFLDMPELGETVEVVIWKKGARNPMITSFLTELENAKNKQ